MKVCAIAGLDPDCDLTPRELDIYASTRQSESWKHTSLLACVMNNLWNRRKCEPSDFDPTIRRPAPRKTTLKEFAERLMREWE
ncbi:MAG TPA: hypothetical protein P5540_19735 [Candidatus Hydrogenedentes bacterium]|nr:hypothetical protein [Candidatus Hydrogenedentota bacterium]